MKGLAMVVLLVAGVSFALALVSKVMLQPFGFLPGGVDATDFLNFTNTALLAAIALGLLQCGKK